MICTNCGMILHEEDAKEHVCNPSDVPQKGKPKKPTTITIDAAI